MIWHETSDPAVVVMLTQTHESGREKCFQYYPLDMENPTLLINEEDEFEDGFQATLTLKNITEDAATRSTIRELELRTTEGETKTVWHLLFGGWPDFLIPEGEDRTALLRLIQFSAEKNTHIESPRVVHCSAGVGRSGTFIALDWLMTELQQGNLDSVPDSVDPIADIVDKLRQQRMMMVQGEQQLWFLYDILKQLWLDRWQQKHGAVGAQAAEAPSEVRDEGNARDMQRMRGELERELHDNVQRL
jgi:protein-tyrosine phosphatase